MLEIDFHTMKEKEKVRKVSQRFIIILREGGEDKNDCLIILEATNEDDTERRARSSRAEGREETNRYKTWMFGSLNVETSRHFHCHFFFEL